MDGPTVIIAHTQFETQHPWPVDCYIQGGSSGVVFSPKGTYGTAFVEVMGGPVSFLRGEGATVAEAEDAAWDTYRRYQECPGHEYEAGRYDNGAGICKLCGAFGSRIFTPEQLGLFCKVCGVPTFWSRWEGEVYCEEHALDPDMRWSRRQQGESTGGGQLEELFDKLFTGINRTRTDTGFSNPPLKED